MSHAQAWFNREFQCWVVSFAGEQGFTLYGNNEQSARDAADEHNKAERGQA